MIFSHHIQRVKQAITTRFGLERRWQDLSLTTKGSVLNALPLTVLLASLALIFESEQQAALLETRVQNALQIQQDIQTLHTQLLEASTGVRDFLLTDNQAFLNGYYQAKDTLPGLLSKLQQKLDDDAQQQLLHVIRPLVQKNLDDLDALANNRAHEASAALISKFASQGEALNRLRQDLNIMYLREVKLMTMDKQQVIRERRHNMRITLTAVIVGVLGSLLGGWIFSNTIVARVKTIRDSATHLVKGEPLALPGISRDELGELTEELDRVSKLLTKSAQDADQARIEAEEASAAKSNFLSRTSHELRTPLNAILGFAQILENDLPNGRQKDSATLIYNAGQHLLKLINEVLDISRIESGDISMSLEVISLNTLLEEACHYIKPLGRVRDIQIETHFAEALYVRADRQRLLQVILNLLANALKYGPENSTVYFNAYAIGPHIRIEVLDEGPGIPLALRSRLFTPFDRLGAERTMTEGTGLGLVLSKQLMDAMGGNIGVAETHSLFWISLPICEAKKTQNISSTIPSVAEPFPLQPISSKNEQKKHVLYVEDHASNRALMEAIMSRHKTIKLHLANSIQDSLIWLRDMQPDLLLVDLNLPDGSGVRLIERFKASDTLREVPIVVLSADALPDTVAKVQAMGIAQYVTKPLNIATFNQLLQQLLLESH